MLPISYSSVVCYDIFKTRGTPILSIWVVLAKTYSLLILCNIGGIVVIWVLVILALDISVQAFTTQNSFTIKLNLWMYNNADSCRFFNVQIHLLSFVSFHTLVHAYQLTQLICAFIGITKNYFHSFAYFHRPLLDDAYIYYPYLHHLYIYILTYIIWLTIRIHDIVECITILVADVYLEKSL